MCSGIFEASGLGKGEVEHILGYIKKMEFRRVHNGG